MHVVGFIKLLKLVKISMSRQFMSNLLRFLAIVTICIIVLSIPQIFANNYQFKLCGVKVIRTTTLKKGPVLLSICLIHVKDTFLKNVKIYVYVYNSTTITPLPIQYSLIYPYQTINFNIITNTTVDKWHIVKIIIWWEKELEVLVSRGGVLVPGYAISVIPKEQKINYTIYIPGNPLLKIFVNPTTLSPSSKYLLNVKICNYGSGNVYDLKLSFGITPSSTTITVVNTSSLNVYRSVLKVGECFSDNMLIVTASNVGFSILRIYGSYVDSIGNIHTVDRSIVLSITSYGLVQVYPKTLSVPLGETSNVSIEICNMYSSPITNVTLTVESVRGAVLRSSSKIPVGTIDSGSCKSINITIVTPRISTQSMSMQSSVAITYLLTYSIPTGILMYKYGTLTIEKLPMPNLQISQITVVPKTPYVGETLVISLLVENYGTASAYNVNISIIPGIGLEPITPTYSVYVREEPYSQVPATFTFNITRSGLLSYKIVITYLDPYGKIHRIVRTEYVKVVKGSLTQLFSYSNVKISGSMMYIPYIVACVVILVIVISIVIAYRRRVRS